MLKKLCKYEFKSIGRTLLPLYVAVLAASVLSGLFGMSFMQGLIESSSILGGLPYMLVNMLYFGLMVALCVCTLLIVIQRFYKGLLCDEGYLMFTLPVKPWQLITAKGIAAVVMSALSGITACVSIFILGAFYGGFDFTVFGQLWNVIVDLTREMPTWPIYALEFLLLCIVATLAGVYELYVSMAIGHLGKNHRVALSFAAYVAVGMITSTIFTALMQLADNMGLMHWLDTLSVSGSTAIHFVLWGAIGWSLVQLAAFFFATERILSKKLNLE